MRRGARPAGLALFAALALPAPGGTQAPTPGAGLTGSWTGWAKLTNDWPSHVCRYEGAAEATSVRLELDTERGRLAGSVAIDLAPEGPGCPPLRKRYTIEEVTVAEGSVAFTDSGGQEWALSLRSGGTVLLGLLAWRAGGPESPLAEDFVLADGTRPMTRLQGEVRLRRADAPESAAAAATESEEPAAAEAASAAASSGSGGGGSIGHIGAILGANAVALGILYGVNKAGEASSETGTITCSPRICIVGNPGEPCFCEGNVLSGAPCGSTTSGVPIGGVCDGQMLPCQAGLSCNGGFCEDNSGPRCPF
jgi:hypothetical protein